MRPQMRDTFSKAFREEAIRQVRESGEPLTKLRRLGRRRTNMRPPEGESHHPVEAPVPSVGEPAALFRRRVPECAKEFRGVAARTKLIAPPGVFAECR